MVVVVVAAAADAAAGAAGAAAAGAAAAVDAAAVALVVVVVAASPFLRKNGWDQWVGAAFRCHDAERQPEHKSAETTRVWHVATGVAAVVQADLICHRSV